MKVLLAVGPLKDHPTGSERRASRTPAMGRAQQAGVVPPHTAWSRSVLGARGIGRRYRAHSAGRAGQKRAQRHGHEADGARREASWRQEAQLPTSPQDTRMRVRGIPGLRQNCRPWSSTWSSGEPSAAWMQGAQQVALSCVDVQRDPWGHPSARHRCWCSHRTFVVAGRPFDDGGVGHQEFLAEVRVTRAHEEHRRRVGAGVSRRRSRCTPRPAFGQPCADRRTPSGLSGAEPVLAEMKPPDWMIRSKTTGRRRGL